MESPCLYHEISRRPHTSRMALAIVGATIVSDDGYRQNKYLGSSVPQRGPRAVEVFKESAGMVSASHRKCSIVSCCPPMSLCTSDSSCAASAACNRAIWISSALMRDTTITTLSNNRHVSQSRWSIQPHNGIYNPETK